MSLAPDRRSREHAWLAGLGLAFKETPQLRGRAAEQPSNVCDTWGLDGTLGARAGGPRRPDARDALPPNDGFVSLSRCLASGWVVSSRTGGAGARAHSRPRTVVCVAAWTEQALTSSSSEFGCVMGLWRASVARQATDGMRGPRATADPTFPPRANATARVAAQRGSRPSSTS